jgi:hypothetical protein
MKRIAVVSALVVVGSGVAYAQSDTELEVIQTIIESSRYTRENLKGPPDDYSSKGALEFWSSGGLLNELPGGRDPEEFDAFSIIPKHIRVITLVEGQAAVAHYYTEGRLAPRGSAPVDHYLTRVTQVFVKEDGRWKIRSSHWSAITGGSGTSQSGPATD